MTAEVSLDPASGTRLAAEKQTTLRFQPSERQPLLIIYSAPVVRPPAPVVNYTSYSNHETAWNFAQLLAPMTMPVEPQAMRCK